MPQKSKTFAQIVPRWSRLIQEHGWPDELAYRAWDVKGMEHSLVLNDIRYCIVGEAHGFDPDPSGAHSALRCDDCKQYGYAFYGMAMGSPYTSGSFAALCLPKNVTFSQLKRAFVKHWNSVHNE